MKTITITVANNGFVIHLDATNETYIASDADEISLLITKILPLLTSDD